MTPIRAVLFDFGNTLFGHDPLATTIARLADELGTPIGTALSTAIAARIDAAAHTPAELTHPRDLDAAVWQARWEALYALGDHEVAGLGAALLADMHDPQCWIPFTTTGVVLAELRAQGVRVGVVSNTGWDVRTAFAHHALLDAVSSFTLSYEVGWTKPDVRIFAAACAALDADPAQTLMVGDDPRADSGATAAGMRVLLLPPSAPGTDNGLDAVLGIVDRSP